MSCEVIPYLVGARMIQEDRGAVFQGVHPARLRQEAVLPEGGPQRPVVPGSGWSVLVRDLGVHTGVARPRYVIMVQAFLLHLQVMI